MKSDTVKHVERVLSLLEYASIEIVKRGLEHDKSKMFTPESELFAKYTPLLSTSTYGGDEYFDFLNKLKPALDHHYANNSHHPEHYKNGINGFDLFDLIEMFFDWVAASERHDDGDIYNSIKINKERFGISAQLCDILTNTADRLEKIS